MPVEASSYITPKSIWKQKDLHNCHNYKEVYSEQTAGMGP